MSVSHPHQLLRQLSQPTDPVWQPSQSSPVPTGVSTAAVTSSVSLSSSSSSTCSWPGHITTGHSAVTVSADMSPVSVKQQPQDTPTTTDTFQPQPASASGNMNWQSLSLSLSVCLLWNVNRKSWVPDQLVSFSMTLSDLWPRFQGHGIITCGISCRCESFQLYKAQM